MIYIETIIGIIGFWLLLASLDVYGFLVVLAPTSDIYWVNGLIVIMRPEQHEFG